MSSSVPEGSWSTEKMDRSSQKERQLDIMYLWMELHYIISEVILPKILQLSLFKCLNITTKI